MDLRQRELVALAVLAATVALAAAAATAAAVERRTEGPAESVTEIRSRPTQIPGEVREWLAWIASSITNPRCPKPDPSVAGLCANTCYGCLAGQMCCPNSCGALQCMDPVSDEPRTTTRKQMEQEPETEGPQSDMLTVVVDYDMPSKTPAPIEKEMEQESETEGPQSDIWTAVVDYDMPPYTPAPIEVEGDYTTEIEDLHTTMPTETTYEHFRTVDYGDYLEWSKSDARCPQLLDLHIPGPCAFLCGECPKDQVCCRNNCGGTECMYPEAPKDKEEYFLDLFKTNSISQYQKPKIR